MFEVKGGGEAAAAAAGGGGDGGRGQGASGCSHGSANLSTEEPLSPAVIKHDRDERQVRRPPVKAGNLPALPASD